eukprot:3365099-Rhodomonas_salina.2
MARFCLARGPEEDEEAGGVGVLQPTRRSPGRRSGRGSGGGGGGWEGGRRRKLMAVAEGLGVGHEDRGLSCRLGLSAAETTTAAYTPRTTTTSISIVLRDGER